MSTGGVTLEKILHKVYQILSNLKQPTPLAELELRLKDVRKCLQSVCKDLKICYMYLPREVPIDRCFLSKSYLYRELNKSLIVYHEQYYDEIRSILVRSIMNYISIYDSASQTLQAVVEFKSRGTTYRYVVIYMGYETFAIITPSTVLRGITNFEDVVRTIIIEVSNNINNYSFIDQIRFITHMNNDRISIKYACVFSYINIYLILLNVIMLLFYINKYFYCT